MNRFIMGRLGIVSLLAALLALGCAIEQTTDGGDDQTETGGESSHSGIGTTADEQVSAGEHSLLELGTGARRPDNGVCPGCGPLPDPWKKMGPLPDPWSSSSSSSGGSSSGSTSSGGESSTSGGAKPK